jgi:MoxR-like ATPase
MSIDSLDEITETLRGEDYVSDDAVSMSLFLALKMGRPLFLEGAPGVGKTEIARVLSHAFDTELIRLQCYEGLDIHHALYEWNYPRQLLQLQAGQKEDLDAIYSDEYLLKRPLLQAIDPKRTSAAVLLIDEIDRADEEFESFLLELLSDFQVTIPELGSVKATHRPIVILTSNRTREIHDALKRRCIYCWIDYPSLEKELAIVSMKVPGLSQHVRTQVVNFVQKLRQEDLLKPPGVAETLDWAEALVHLGIAELDAETVRQTLGVVLKNQEDISIVERLLDDQSWAGSGCSAFPSAWTRPSASRSRLPGFSHSVAAKCTTPRAPLWSIARSTWISLTGPSSNSGSLVAPVRAHRKRRRLLDTGPKSFSGRASSRSWRRRPGSRARRSKSPIAPRPPLRSNGCSAKTSRS